MAVAHNVIIGVDEDGEHIRIPPGSMVIFHSQSKDWRRVRVCWKTHVLSISSAAWQICSGQEDKPPPREALTALAQR